MSQLSLCDDVNEFVGVLIMRAERAQNWYEELRVQRDVYIDDTCKRS